MEQTKSVETLQILSDFRAQLAHDNVDTEEYQPYFEKLQYLVNYIGCLERKNRALNEKNEKVEVLNDQIKELTNEKSRLKIKITVMTTERDCFHSTINNLEFERDEALRQTQIAKQEVCTSNEQLKKAKRDLRDEHNYYLCAKQELDELRKEIDQEVEGLHAKITELKDTVDTLQSRLLQKDEEISLTKARAVKAEKRSRSLKTRLLLIATSSAKVVLSGVSFMSDDVKAEETSPTQTSTPARTPKKRRMLLGCMPSPFYRKKKDRSTK
uniref:Cilia- and flagella-associated protein 157 n=1 Tax=Ditylenchus dipsaci TaxID=166011 RepID=A0A915EPP7_9BILA